MGPLGFLFSLLTLNSLSSNIVYVLTFYIFYQNLKSCLGILAVCREIGRIQCVAEKGCWNWGIKLKEGKNNVKQTNK